MLVNDQIAGKVMMPICTIWSVETFVKISSLLLNRLEISELQWRGCFYSRRTIKV